MEKGKRKKILYYIYLLLIFAPCLEIALRILQYEPYRQEEFLIQASPTQCLIPHPTLGFALNPGSFSVQINQAKPYTVTHGPDSLRVTHASSLADSLEKIFLLGCSYTYGMGVDDTESFPYLLQEAFPKYMIKNFGVPGFGNVQSYLQLESEILKGNIPKLVILNLVDFHLERNVLTPDYRKNLHMGFARSSEEIKDKMKPGRIPFILSSEEELILGWESWDSVYQNWRGRESLASVNLFQSIADRWEREALDPTTQSLQLFEAFQALCEKHEIIFCISNLRANKTSEELLEAISELGIDTLDMGLDLLSTDFSSLPEDSHPNTSAHRHYFKKISVYLQKILPKTDLEG
ncbi:MAG: hypothetical protein AAGD28_26700 [Bacteroidota bacterium]